MINKTLTAISGIRIGHHTDHKNHRGCTVILFPQDGVTAGVDVRGSAPGTRETDLLSPINLVNRIHALVLSGGSAFGLGAADGVLAYLAEREIGLDVGIVRVPIVPAAVLFDLHLGNPKIHPDASWGYAAAKNASNLSTEEGNIGAGTGATVGKIKGMGFAMKSGLGSFAIELPNGVVVAALAVTNSVGDVLDPKTGKILAGTRGKNRGEFLDSGEVLKGLSLNQSLLGGNTTLGIIATNTPCTKVELTKIAQMAQDGLARAIRPAHTMFDGDTIFAVSVPNAEISYRPDVTTLGSVAADVFAEAVLRSVKSAQSIDNLPAWSDWVTVC